MATEIGQFFKAVSAKTASSDQPIEANELDSRITVCVIFLWYDYIFVKDEVPSTTETLVTFHLVPKVPASAKAALIYAHHYQPSNVSDSKVRKGSW